jgi:hypothetical protein
MWVVGQWKKLFWFVVWLLVGCFMTWIIVLGIIAAWPVIINFFLTIFTDIEILWQHDSDLSKP